MNTCYFVSFCIVHQLLVEYCAYKNNKDEIPFTFFLLSLYTLVYYHTMNFFPSPPSSPLLNNSSKVICGSCNKSLSSDWFCSDCHIKCNTCNRFLAHSEFCSRCWSFDDKRHCLVRKRRHHYLMPTMNKKTKLLYTA
jgi:hypothetical protein